MTSWKVRREVRRLLGESSVVRCTIDLKALVRILKGIIAGFVMTSWLTCSLLIVLSTLERHIAVIMIIAMTFVVTELVFASPLEQLSRAMGYALAKMRIRRMLSIELGGGVTACDVARLSLASFFVSSLTWGSEKEDLISNARNAIKYLLSRDFRELIDSIKKINPQIARKILDLVHGNECELMTLSKRLLLLMLRRDLLLLATFWGPLALSVMLLAYYMSVVPEIADVGVVLLFALAGFMLAGALSVSATEVTGEAWDMLASVRQLGIRIYHELRKAVMKLRSKLKVPIILIVWTPGLEPSREVIIVRPVRQSRSAGP